MLNAKDLTEIIGVEKTVEVVGAAVSKYLEENMDIYESFIDTLFTNISSNPAAMAQVESAMLRSIIDRLNRGDFDNAGNEILEETLKGVFGKVSAKIVSVL